jgi:molybdopterin biosynthesis enzyme
MRTIAVEDAVGTILAHDLTQIVPGQFKGSRFKKGHLIQPEDIPVLLAMGKENLYVLELAADDVHEEDAAWRIATATAGTGIRLVAKGEGKVELVANQDGLLQVDRAKLRELIDDDEVMFATLPANHLVRQGQVLAGTRVIPLIVKEAQVARCEKLRGLIAVQPLKRSRIGIVTTGSEIYQGRIKDAFGPLLIQKFAALGSEVVLQLFADDQPDMIADCIRQVSHAGVDLIAVTGGMSVDPDDRTPAGIRQAGAKIETYGAPVLPGAMFLLSYLPLADGREIPLIGLPGCVMYHCVSIFELIVPRLLAGERVVREDIKDLAVGGLCCNCQTCHYPGCGFGNR